MSNIAIKSIHFDDDKVIVVYLKTVGKNSKARLSITIPVETYHWMQSDKALITFINKQDEV